MRELISGRDFSVDTGVQWSADDEEAKRNQTVDLSGKQRNATDDDNECNDQTIPPKLFLWKFCHLTVGGYHKAAA